MSLGFQSLTSNVYESKTVLVTYNLTQHDFYVLVYRLRFRVLILYSAEYKICPGINYDIPNTQSVTLLFKTLTALVDIGKLKQST